MNLKDIIKKIKRIEIRSKKKTDAQPMGNFHSTFKGQGMTFSEVRQYQFGDDIRRIDWNKTAHFQEPFVKLMEEEKELTMMLLVDISSSMNYGTKNQLKREYIAEICASLGFSAIEMNDKVGLILFSDKIYKVIPPQKGKKHLLTMINQIISTEHIPSQTSIDKALEYVMRVFKKKSLIFIFSDFNDEINTKTLKTTAKKHELLGIRVFDEKDNEIPDIGYAEFKDIETGQNILVNTSNPRFRYNFAETKRQQIKETEQLFKNSSAKFINLNTGIDYTKSFYKLYKK